MLPGQRTDLTGSARSNLSQKGFSRESAQMNHPQPLKPSHRLRLSVAPSHWIHRVSRTWRSICDFLDYFRSAHNLGRTSTQSHQSL